MPPDDEVDRSEELSGRGKELREEMADLSRDVGEVFESLADFHDHVEGIDGHPLRATATDRADHERRVAAKERSVGCQLREQADD